MALDAGTRLGPYEIRAPIGVGGMGEVYRATDPRLGRDVAIKVLPEELARDPDRLSRFEQEARAASALNHPNIVTIHDIGSQGAVHYIAMELVDGETLREILSEGRLPVEELLRIAVQVAEGLAKAHAAGIVHRDLKPENVMLTEDGYVKILDFGLAKLSPHGGLLTSETVTIAKAVTEQGVLLGTAHYMSPEQARGVTVDYRSDQFSFGIILYEMATGELPFHRETAAQTLAAIIEAAPERLLERNPELPAGLVAVVDRCLAKDPVKRYESTEELALELRKLGNEPYGRDESPIRQKTPRSHIRSVAVLPLTHIGAESDEEYFADGMTEALITDLAKIGAMKVISRTSAMRYRNTDKSLREIASELNVDAVVEGSVLRSGNQVRISAQLIDAATDEHLWAESYQRDFHDILTLQSKVARAIAREIQIQLAPHEEALFERAHPVDPAAHEAYLKGRYYMNKSSPDGWRKALDYFQLALEKNPDHALAHAGLADTHNLLGIYGLVSPQKAVARAKAAAVRALELDETLAEAHAALALVKVFYDRDWTAAELEFRRAFELNPGSATTHAQYAIFCRSTGRPDQSLSEIRRALELDPLSVLINTTFAYLLYSLRRYDEAIDHCKKTLELDPNTFQVHAYLAMIYRRRERFDEAVSEWESVVTLMASRRVSRGMRRTFDELGFDAALARLAQSIARAFYVFQALGYLSLRKARRISPILIAMLYAEAGENDRAIRWLEKACVEGEPQIIALGLNPHWDGLRSDPRFEEMVKRHSAPKIGDTRAQ